MALVTRIYEATKHLPKEERFGLTSQIRRASVSVRSNIAEWQGRDSTKEYIHHLSNAYGSLMELETQLLIAKDLDYIDKEKTIITLKKTGELGRLINGLKRALNRKLAIGH